MNIRHAGPKLKTQLLKQLDRLVDAGRITMEEAARLCAGACSSDFDEQVRGIRDRHMRETLDMAIERGVLDRDEADALIRDFERSEDPGPLRALHRRLRRSDPDGDRLPSSLSDPDDPET